MLIEEKENINFKLIFKINRQDLKAISVSILSNLIIWFYLRFHNHLFLIQTYGDATIYSYVSRHFYHKIYQNDIQFTKALPLTPIILYILHILTFGNWMIASLLYILLTASLATYFFNKFLITFRIFKTPKSYFWLLSFFPLRYIAIRSVVNSESLYFAFLFIILISLRFRAYKTLHVFICLALLTNEQGLILWLAILIYFCLNNNNSERNKLLIWPFISFFILGLFNSACGNNFLEYFISIFKGFSIIPFYSLLKSSSSIATLNEFHTQYMYFFFGFIGLVFMIKKSKVLTIIIALSLFYLSLMPYGNIFHRVMQYDLFSLLALDDFIKSSGVKRILPVFLFGYILSGYIYAFNNINYSVDFRSVL